MRSAPTTTSAWVRLALHPSGYAHDSWLPALPFELADASAEAREAVEAELTRRASLSPLTRADSVSSGASVSLIAKEVHGTLVEALTIASAWPPVESPAGSREAALAGLLLEKPLPWRQVRAAASDPACHRRLLSEQVQARLSACASALTPALSERWRLRHPRHLRACSVAAEASAVAMWWQHVEDCLARLYDGMENVPCV